MPQVLNRPAAEGQGLFSPVSSLYAARALRDFGDGFVAVLLPVYLSAIGLDVFQIGVVATTALLGSALMTLAIGFFGHRIDRRTVLIAASGLMVATGLAFTQSASYGAVLLVAFCGTINPSSGSVSIFVPLEHAALSHLVADKARTSAFARYSLMGALAAAVGALAAMGPDLLADFGVSRLAALEGMFALYAVLGIAGSVFYSRIPRSAASAEARSASALGPSRGIVYRMAALFSIDAFAGGFAVQSLMALWLFSRFGLSLSAAGLFFFWSGVLSAFSFPVAAWLSRRIGLVNTMVFTHIPSSLCLILAAVVPSLEAALGLLLLRSALSQMDVPTRSSFVMAVVTPPERAAAASITSVPRSLAAALSPMLAGALFAAGYEAWPFILCGALKILYDIALLQAFRHIKPPEEQ
ncbi:MFS transporter [Xanthobacter flavus]|uniref:MFS transporter n=1 Tax=Xanthobacter flavus TaxID=281 RepID=UPI001E0C211B|nr:MFS family permease [Xanthobacter flavus]